MRVKMSYASAPTNTMTPSLEANKALRRSLCTFVGEANDAAIALYTITQLSPSMFGSRGIQRDIAHKFLRVAGVVSSLLATCHLDALPDAVRQQLNAHIERCQPVLHKIDLAVQKLHEHYEPWARRCDTMASSAGAFEGNLEREVADVLEQFFRLAMMVRLGVTATSGLTGFGNIRTR